MVLFTQRQCAKQMLDDEVLGVRCEAQGPRCSTRSLFEGSLSSNNDIGVSDHSINHVQDTRDTCYLNRLFLRA